jgi:hypothetical protein
VAKDPVQHLRDYKDLRIVLIKGSYYVVGRGRYIHVDNRREAEELIAELERSEGK